MRPNVSKQKLGLGLLFFFFYPKEFWITVRFGTQYHPGLLPSYYQMRSALLNVGKILGSAPPPSPLTKETTITKQNRTNQTKKQKKPVNRLMEASRVTLCELLVSRRKRMETQEWEKWKEVGNGESNLSTSAGQPLGMLSLFPKHPFLKTLQSLVSR